MAFITCPCLNIQIHVAEPITEPITEKNYKVRLENIYSIQTVFPSLVGKVPTATDPPIERKDERDEVQGEKWREHECLHCNSGPIYLSSAATSASHQPLKIVFLRNAVLYTSIQEAIKQVSNYSKTLNMVLDSNDDSNPIQPIPKSIKNIPSRLRPFYREIKQKLDQTTNRLRLESKVRAEMMRSGSISSLSKSQAKAFQEAADRSIQQAIADYNKMWSLVVPRLENTANAQVEAKNAVVTDDHQLAKEEEEETMFFLDEEVLSDTEDDEDTAIDRKKISSSFPEIDHKKPRWIKKRQTHYSRNATEDDEEEEEEDEITDKKDKDCEDEDVYSSDHIAVVEKKKAETNIDELAISEFATSVPITINYYRASEEDSQAFSTLGNAL